MSNKAYILELKAYASLGCAIYSCFEAFQWLFAVKRTRMLWKHVFLEHCSNS